MKIYKEELTSVLDKTICDLTGNPACSTLILSFGYGSDFDMSELKLDLDNESSKEILNLLIDKYGDKVKNCIKEY